MCRDYFIWGCRWDRSNRALIERDCGKGEGEAEGVWINIVIECAGVDLLEVVVKRGFCILEHALNFWGTRS